MNKYAAIAFVITSGLVLSACSNSGTTYGTGTSHELATVKGLSNIFSLKSNDQAKIDYSARPDLVMPANKNALPSPEDQANSDVENWPVSPEERQAIVQDAAPKDNDNARSSGGIDTAFALSEKEGINVQQQRRTRSFDPSIDSSRASGATEALRDIQTGKNKRTRSTALTRKGELTYTSGSAPRRFLTEPPAEYRTPAATAEAGDLGISQTELTEREKRDAKEAEATHRGIFTPGAN